MPEFTVTTIPIVLSFWGLVAMMLYAGIISNECPGTTKELFGYIIMSFVVGWTSFLVACVKAELNAAQFPFAAIPLLLQPIWGGQLLSRFTGNEMEPPCKQNLWYCAAFLFLGQVCTGTAFIYFYFCQTCKKKRVSRPESIFVFPVARAVSDIDVFSLP